MYTHKTEELKEALKKKENETIWVLGFGWDQQWINKYSELMLKKHSFIWVTVLENVSGTIGESNRTSIGIVFLLKQVYEKED